MSSNRRSRRAAASRRVRTSGRRQPSRRAAASGRLRTSVRGQPSRRAARKWVRMWWYLVSEKVMFWTALGCRLLEQVAGLAHAESFADHRRLAQREPDEHVERLGALAG